MVCLLLDAEMALDLLEAELAEQLAPHVLMFADAHAAGRVPPPAPEAAGRPTTIAIARQALAHPVLADRALAILRVAVPLSIETAPEVAAARAAPATWEALGRLAAARDRAARARVGLEFIELMHRLHGSGSGDGLAQGLAPVPAVAGWDRAVAPWTHADVHALLEELSRRHGIATRGAVAMLGGAGIRPRAFIASRVSIVVAIPDVIATPSARFSVLHELGHVLAGAALGPGLPRVVDEAAAAYIARLMEDAGGPWFEPLASAARERRTALAIQLDAIERALPDTRARPAERPPWALWHDPGAQRAYVAAEALAAELWRELGAAPAPQALAAALARARDRIDHATVI
ncbi:MAG: hypothetical protein AB7P03_29135 [Kofleriaceae bacterium]